MPRRQTLVMLAQLHHPSGLYWPGGGTWYEDGLGFPSSHVGDGGNVGMKKKTQ